MKQSRTIRNIKLGVKSLMLHKLRSLLTMLGVVFGVASVIAMLAIGEGSKRKALEQIERLGTNNIILNSKKPVNAGGSGSAQAADRVLTYGLKYIDAERLKETIPGLQRVVPVRKLPKSIRLRDRAVDISVVGTTPAWFDLVERPVLAGRVLTDLDETRAAPVVVLTEQLARRLMGASHTIGQSVMIGDKNFTVVGIVHSESRLDESGGTLDADIDAYIPLTACRALFGELIIEQRAGQQTAELVELHRIVAQTKDREQVESTAIVIRRMLERFHNDVDYEVSVPLELLQRATETQNVFNLMLGSIAGISLLVGGIGIMNIMLASVTERTREIGVRRAIGARRSQIISQFLTESMLLSISGGLIGLVLGVWLLPFSIERISASMGRTMETIVPMYSIVLSLGISVAVGVVFGLYPAIRAAQLDPIVALRHE
jgi:putative ABC transport system permease protein